MDILKISAKTNASMAAGALAGVIRESGSAGMQAIGAGAVNQAVKAIAIAGTFLASSGIRLVCTPSFIQLEIDGEERTAISFSIEAAPLAAGAESDD